MMDRRRFMMSALATAGGLAVMPRISTARIAEGLLEITAEQVHHSLAPGQIPESPLWLYDGMTPGPEIRVKKGETVQVRLVNRLPEPTSIHWHGIRIGNAMDGVAGLTQDAVEPGGTFDYEFVVPDAGTYWYHAHNRSWNQVARGLYGPLIVEEPGPSFDRDHDITLVVDDWRVDRSGRLDFASIGAMMDWSHGGRLGNLLTVNGGFSPEFGLVAGEAYRLRLINASNARILEFDPARFNARVLAWDGQPLPGAQTLPYAPLLLGPAQRVDLLVTPVAGGDFRIDEISASQEIPIARFPVSGSAARAAVPPRLAPNGLREPDPDTAQLFRLDMTGGAMGRFVETTYNGKVLDSGDFSTTGQVWAFNGVANLAENPFFSVGRGESVVIDMVNNTAFVHAMHVHGHHFRVIERDGSTVDEGKPWRDTFLIGPDQTTRIAFVADNPGKWLLHCHMLEHAAAGMNTWFEVT